MIGRLGGRWKEVLNMPSFWRLLRVVVPVLILACEPPRLRGKDLKPHPRMGMNISSPVYWNSELPFVDVFRTSRPWISQRQGSPFGQGPPLTLDKHGWVTRMEPNSHAEAYLCVIKGGHYPSGIYTVFYEGDGILEAGGSASVVSRRPGSLQLQVNPQLGPIILRLRATSPNNHLRNVHVIMPGFVKSYKTNPWHPLFLERWKGIAALRFMDLMRTNDSTVKTWSDRPTMDDSTFFTRGVPLELLIDLANRLKADAWFCVPHMADDEYVREMATLVKAKLSPELKVYLEYSNELWNSVFKQNKYVCEEGTKHGFHKQPWEAGWRYTAYRSVQIFTIWERIFGKARLVRLLATQTANPYVTKQILQFRDAYQHADALAIGPYLTLLVFGSTGGPPHAVRVNEAANWTVPQFIDHIKQKCMPEVRRWITEQKALASHFGLKLVVYEGGQHLVGVGGEAVGNKQLTQLFMQVNRDPAMGAIYNQYFDMWQQLGGDLFCYFISVAQWDQNGCWGICEYYDELPSQSPKYSAVIRQAKKWGQSLAPVNSGRSR